MKEGLPKIEETKGEEQPQERIEEKELKRREFAQKFQACLGELGYMERSEDGRVVIDVEKILKDGAYKIYEGNNVKRVSYDQKSEKLFLLLSNKILSVEI